MKSFRNSAVNSESKLKLRDKDHLNYKDTSQTVSTTISQLKIK
jgi:hypothetical protein